MDTKKIQIEMKNTLKNYSKPVDKEIEASLNIINPSTLREASEHLFKAGGKKLRPVLVRLACESVGGGSEDALKAAAAMDLINIFSIIHDDIMDKDKMRRGIPSVHTLWGESMAILAGDMLIFKAYETMLTMIGQQKLQDVLKTVNGSFMEMCEGQALDLIFEGRLDVNEEEYMVMINKKTGALLSASAKAGAIIGGGTDEQIEALSEYGRLIGLAYQLQNDYLDIVSNEEDIGKPVGSDVIAGKMTLMVIHTLGNASKEDKEKLKSILLSNDEGRVLEAIELFNKYRSIDYIRDIGSQYVKTAKNLLNILEDSEAKKSLELFAEFVGFDTGSWKSFHNLNLYNE